MESPGARRNRVRPPRPSRAPDPLRRRRLRMSTALACVAVVGVTAVGAGYARSRAHPDAGGAPSAAAPSAGAPTAAPADDGAVRAESGGTPAAEDGEDGEASVEQEPGVPSAADLTDVLADALDAVDAADGAEVSVAVLDTATGDSAVYGRGAFDTASIVKVDILSALLLRAQDAGRRLTSAERAYATAMIENSDNDSASALWRAIGQADGLDTANRRLGLTGTEGGAGMLWGLTRTTAADQLVLLRQVFGTESALTEASRSYVRELMGRIASGQRWGVSAAADGSDWALKNGWLPRSTTGLWDVNSIGRVAAGGRDVLVAVLSRGSTTQAEGIALVEAAARAAVRSADLASRV
ncbi:serine hydrolase [Streptomyces sp. MS06]|uniref:serine hydrolase n=1 Tax=Streptomyces sp. MS06 TaxID=3385974 RepID=UPI0039A0255F